MPRNDGGEIGLSQVRLGITPRLFADIEIIIAEITVGHLHHVVFRQCLGTV